jgi:hypothetical protein
MVEYFDLDFGLCTDSPTCAVLILLNVCSFVQWGLFGKFPKHRVRYLQGDFLSEESQAIIKQCNIIFCNNYTFPSELNLKLKTIFEDLPDGMFGASGHNIKGPRFFNYLLGPHFFWREWASCFSLRLGPRQQRTAASRSSRAFSVIFFPSFFCCCFKEWRCTCLNDKRLPHLSSVWYRSALASSAAYVISLPLAVRFRPQP